MLRSLKTVNPRNLGVNPRSLRSNNKGTDDTRFTTSSQHQQSVSFSHENELNNGNHPSHDNSYWTALPSPVHFPSNAESESCKIPNSSSSAFSDTSRQGRTRQRRDFGSSEGHTHSHDSSHVQRTTPCVLSDTEIPV